MTPAWSPAASPPRLRPLLLRRRPLHRLMSAAEPTASTSPSPASWSTRPAPPGRPASSRSALALAVCGIFAEGFMFRAWVYSIIGARSRPRRPAQPDRRRDPRLSSGLPRRQRVRGAVLPGRDDPALPRRSAAEPVAARRQSRGSSPRSRPLVQPRTMSRIESTPTSSRVDDDQVADPPLRHLLGRLLEAPVGGGGDDAVAHVVGDQLGVGVLAGADRVQDVALGDDPRRRGSRRRRPARRRFPSRSSSSRPRAACGSGPPSGPPPTCHPVPASGLLLSGSRDRAIASSLPDTAGCASRFRGGPAYRLRRASRRTKCPSSPNPIRAARRPRRPGALS